jgi:cyclopropane fatty-acyl-phospholipid synthase-like methyltransferase
MPIEKPFSQACENNKGPILEVLAEHLTKPARLLEVGSGTGQHAVWLAQHLPHIQWQPSDVRENLSGIRLWLNETSCSNLLAPIELDVRNRWPNGSYDALFTANSLHIMSQHSAALCIAGGASVLGHGGFFMIYGPFNYNGRFTSDSNAQFQQWLQARNPESGIRDAEWVSQTMAQHGLSLVKDHQMPANNRLLVFQRTAH